MSVLFLYILVIASINEKLIEILASLTLVILFTNGLIHIHL